MVRELAIIAAITIAIGVFVSICAPALGIHIPVPSFK